MGLRLGRINEKQRIYRSYAVFYKGAFADRAISKVVWLVDAEKNKKEYTEEQLGER